MRKLYKVEVFTKRTLGTVCNGIYYVVSKNESGASQIVMQKWKEWDYMSNAYVGRIELLVTEGQYGKPETLLIGQEQ